MSVAKGDGMWCYQTPTRRAPAEKMRQSKRFSCSDAGGVTHPALVSPVRGPFGDEAPVHVEHFSVYRVLRRAGSDQGKLISHIFRETEVFLDTEWERYFCYEDIVVPDVYTGPHLTFPLSVSNVTDLVEAFKQKQQLHSRYVLQLLGETWRLLRVLPNINMVSTRHSKEITICGDLHGQLEDLLLVFYKNGLPSIETPYVFNGDFVDRGKDSIEILLILFAFQLVYPNDIHLNRGNHEDHIVNLRYTVEELV